MQLQTISDIPIKKGITLNIQHIELLSIINANTIDELNSITKNTFNILPAEADKIIQKSSDLESAKIEIFKLYKSSLLSFNNAYLRNDSNYFIKKHIRKYISKYYSLSHEQQYKIRKAFSLDNEMQIYEEIKKTLPYYASEMLKMVTNFMPIESAGVLITNYEEFQKILQIVKKYDIINLDNILRYETFYQADDKPNFHSLTTALDFVRKLEKKARIGSIIFYPSISSKWLYEKSSSRNCEDVKNELFTYVTDITKFLLEYEQSTKYQIVDSIEFLKEPLNTFPLHKKTQYKLRREIFKRCANKYKAITNNNIKPGWMNFLDINDICELCSRMKQIAPDFKIMFSECHLEDEQKSKVFLTKVILPVKDFENKNNITILDIIGTQCHCDSNTSVSDIQTMLDKLSTTNKNIEITEFDLSLLKDIIPIWFPEEYNLYKSLYYNLLFETITNYCQQYKLIGFTIDAIINKMDKKINQANFAIYQENKHNKKGKKEYVSTLFSGYYDDNLIERQDYFMDW